MSLNLRKSKVHRFSKEKALILTFFHFVEFLRDKNLRFHPGFKLNLKIYQGIRENVNRNQPITPLESNGLPLQGPNDQCLTRSKQMPVKEVSESRL